jgi:hypothetical protein
MDEDVERFFEECRTDGLCRDKPETFDHLMEILEKVYRQGDESASRAEVAVVSADAAGNATEQWRGLLSGGRQGGVQTALHRGQRQDMRRKALTSRSVIIGSPLRLSGLESASQARGSLEPRPVLYSWGAVFGRLRRHLAALLAAPQESVTRQRGPTASPRGWGESLMADTVDSVDPHMIFRGMPGRS